MFAQRVLVDLIDWSKSRLIKFIFISLISSLYFEKSIFLFLKEGIGGVTFIYKDFILYCSIFKAYFALNIYWF